MKQLFCAILILPLWLPVGASAAGEYNWIVEKLMDEGYDLEHANFDSLIQILATQNFELKKRIIEKTMHGAQRRCGVLIQGVSL